MGSLNTELCNTYYQSIVYTEYPIEILLTNEEKLKCKSDKLKERGTIYVQKTSYPETLQYKFTAVFETEDRTALSTLNAEKGFCNDVKTKKGYQGCGLAKYLMAICFQDVSILGEDGRGVNVYKDPLGIDHWKTSPMRIDAYEYCKTMIYLSCATEPNRNCISYLRAAAFANSDLLFSFRKGINIKAFKIGKRLESEFDKKSDEFIDNNGHVWYFCKCKEESKFSCLAIASNEP